MVLASSCFVPWTALARGDGVLHLYAYHLKETAVIRYRDGEKILPEGVVQIQKIFRSRDSNQEKNLDPKLLELLDTIEDHFGIRQVEIISGYRSQEFNQSLKDAGRTVAKESLHIQGMAADVHLDEITEESLRDYVASLRAGGVGYYPSLNFVHVDVGPVRHWSEEAPRKTWVGEREENVPVLITVTPDRSLTKKLDSARIEYVSGGIPRKIGRMEVQFFDRGEWKDTGVDVNPGETCETIGGAPKTLSLQHNKGFEKLPFGKFRFRADLCGEPRAHQYSNEFYFKKM